MAMTLLEFYKRVYKKIDLQVYRRGLIQQLIDQVEHDLKENEKLSPEDKLVLLSGDPSRLRAAIKDDPEFKKLDFKETDKVQGDRVKAFGNYIAWAYFADEPMVACFEKDPAKFKKTFGIEESVEPSPDGT